MFFKIKLAGYPYSSDNTGTMKTINQSLLYPINDQFAEVNDFETGQRLILEHLNSLDSLKGSNVRDVKKMIHTVTHEIQNLRKLQFWFYNNLQAYVGCKIVQNIPR